MCDLYALSPTATLAGAADFFNRLDEQAFSAERYNVVHITNIIDVGNERDMGVCPACNAELISNMFLELDKGVHVCSGSGEHIV